MFCSYCGCSWIKHRGDDGSRQTYSEMHEANCPLDKSLVAVTHEMFIRPSWDEIFMGFAVSLSRRSSCRRLQVGCVVVSENNNRVLSIGYNGNYQGGPNDCDSDEPGACGCIHSEINSIAKLDYNDPSGKVMFITDSPCMQCAKLIVNAGIKRVVYAREYRVIDGLELLKRAGVETASISIGEL